LVISTIELFPIYRRWSQVRLSLMLSMIMFVEGVLLVKIRRNLILRVAEEQKAF
jgi:hypothetical protein